MTTYLTMRQVMVIAREAVGADVQLADPGLLASALTRPSMSVFGADAYDSIERKAAAQLESIARNHTLVDGNKRLAWVATVIFLRINGFNLYADADDGEAFVLAVAADHLSLDDIEAWIAAHVTFA